MKKENLKPFVWGMAVGMVVLLFVIFSAGWVVTSGTAKAEAKAMATDAVMNRLAPIAIAQFMEGPNKEAQLKELKKLDYLDRSAFVKTQGWATMPGEKEPQSDVVNECARRLMDLKI